MTLVGEDELQSSSEPHVHERSAVVLWLQENQNCEKVHTANGSILSHTLTFAKRMSIRVKRVDFSSWPIGALGHVNEPVQTER
jgi:hypothetical protein